LYLRGIVFSGYLHAGNAGCSPTHHARGPESLQEVTEMTTKQSQETDFTRDVLGRYICNGMDEALASTNPNGQRQPSNNIGRGEEALELD